MLLTVMLLPMITWVNLLDFSSIARAFALRWSLVINKSKITNPASSRPVVIDDYDVAVVEDKNDYNVGVLYYVLMKQG